MLRWVGAVALMLAFPPAAARADQPGAVSLVVDPCVAVDAVLVTRLFQVELGSALAPLGNDPAITRVELGCADELVELRVHDAVTGKSLTRRIAAGPATGRERLLALAAMELLVASWVELEATPAATRRSADSTADNAVRDSARAMVRRRLPVITASRWTTTATLVATSWRSGLSHWGGGARLIFDASDSHWIDAPAWNDCGGSVLLLCADGDGEASFHPDLGAGAGVSVSPKCTGIEVRVRGAAQVRSADLALRVSSNVSAACVAALPIATECRIHNTSFGYLCMRTDAPVMLRTTFEDSQSTGALYAIKQVEYIFRGWVAR